jgi:hypothetical protein
MKCNYEAMHFVNPLSPPPKKISTIKMNHPRLYCGSTSILKFHEAKIKNEANGKFKQQKNPIL